jgi:hypothetical protein
LISKEITMSTNATLSVLSFDQAVLAIDASIRSGDKTPIIMQGPIGCGKTSVPLAVAVNHGIPREVAERCVFRPSLRDPIDLVGLPHTERDADGDLYTYWSANSFIKYVNDVAEKYGLAILTIDELMQAVPMMQNALGGLLHDRVVGENRLHDRVFIVCTGNRVSDKAGSGRLMSQIPNRCEMWEMRPDLDAWSNYMLDKGYDPMIVAYARFDAGCIDDIDPDRPVNGTMRSMEAAAKLDPESMPEDIYLAKLAGRIPEARAAQYIAFRKLVEILPTEDEMIKTPTTAKLPTDNRGALFAASSLAFRRVTRDTWKALVKYMERVATEAFAPDIEAAFYKDIVNHKPELVETDEFTAWATTRGADVTLY